MRRNPILAQLEERAGIYFPGSIEMLAREPVLGQDGKRTEWGDFVHDASLKAINLAMDASTVGPQNSLITSPNAGMLGLFTTYVDPKLIEVLLQPVKAAEIYGETRKGDWLDETSEFPVVESTGYTSSYGDYSTSGRAGANVQWVPRQSYLYQTFTQFGEREAERMGRAKVDWVARLNISSAITLSRFQNTSYFFGITSLTNYGALNDPSLSAALTPTTKAAGGTGWAKALPTEILADIQYAFTQLQLQTGSNLELTDRMTLALHSVSETYLANTNSFGLTAMEMIKKVFPNIRVIQAPQFLSGTTYSLQLFIDEVEGQRSVECCFNEKMRSHRVVYDVSSEKQKKTQGTWGTIWYRPICVVSMSGI